MAERRKRRGPPPGGYYAKLHGQEVATATAAAGAPGLAILVALKLLAHGRAELAGRDAPSAATLATLAGVSPRAALGIVERLERAGLVRLDRGRGRKARFELLDFGKSCTPGADITEASDATPAGLAELGTPPPQDLPNLEPNIGKSCTPGDVMRKDIRKDDKRAARARGSDLLERITSSERQRLAELAAELGLNLDTETERCAESYAARGEAIRSPALLLEFWLRRAVADRARCRTRRRGGSQLETEPPTPGTLARLRALETMHD